MQGLANLTTVARQLFGEKTNKKTAAAPDPKKLPRTAKEVQAALDRVMGLQ